MGQWMMIVMALIGGLLVAVTKSSVVAGLGVIMFLGGLIGATFSLAASLRAALGFAASRTS